MTDIPWDEMPEGATHYDPEDSIRPWMKLEADGWSAWKNDEWNFFGFDDEWVEDGGESRCMPVPKCTPKPQWRGPEDGLPPVGTVCEKAPHWYKCEIIAEHDGGLVIYDMHNLNYYKVGRGMNFRPLPTKRDQWVEKATQRAKEAAGHEYGLLDLRVVSAIHDALISGELPPPEQE